MCSFEEACTVSLLSDIIIPDCYYKWADYIAVEYRLIPRKTYYLSFFLFPMKFIALFYKKS